MTPPAPDEAGHLLAAALDHDPAEREAFLDAACGGNAALREELRQMLAAHLAMPEDFLAAPVAELRPKVAVSPEQPGEMIGHYKLREQIGAGGFGTVWVADQEQPVRRRVALKIIKLGMDTEDVITRFEQERQALAMMDHPNIAKVLDAGATQTGRPYFVMELVRGVKITEYCDEMRLATRERIELFIKVCQAVQHAHQKGVIHRDLKPSNILATVNDGAPVPKVIDFGVAKATQGRLTEHTIYTKFQQMVGTPLYMSPEQAELTSLDVDTRSDIYALGVLLYELLTGSTPIDTETMAKAGMDEIRRLIREVDPPLPSQRVKTLAGAEMTAAAERRHTDATKLPTALRGDLDWIVMKCLEKDRNRRYDTANGLTMDLLRHLSSEPVGARPPTTAYLLGRLIRRNRLAFVASAGILASLLIGITVSVWQALRANRALDELRASAPAFAEQARGLAAQEQFAEALAKLDYAIKLRPEVAEYLVAKGDLLQSQLQLAEAARVYREALRVQPGLARAEASAKLCDELLAAKPNDEGKLTRESLAKLHLLMQQQQRPAAELMPIARRLGEEKKLLLDYWLTRLQSLPISGERPLRVRLSVRDDGRLSLDLRGTKVTDFSPLTAAPLGRLDLSGTEIADLSLLRGLDLIELNVSKTGVADITPLKEMRSLESLDLAECKVTDLAPLLGLPLRIIDLSDTPVLDFGVLAQLPLERCYLRGSRIRDLGVLRGRPLRELVLLGCDNTRNYAALTGLATLELLLMPPDYRTLPEEDYQAIGALRKLPRLRQLGTEYTDGMGVAIVGVGRLKADESGESSSHRYSATPAKEIFWQQWDIEQKFVPALRKTGFNFFLNRLPNGLYDLWLVRQPIRDLSIIKGAPICHLQLIGGEVADLSPLQGMPLTYLNIPGNPVTDLSPLRGMPLERMFLTNTKVSDLSPLAGIPIKSLYLGRCDHVKDLAPLLQVPTLENLVVPPQAANVDALRAMPNLRRLGYELTGLQPMLPETSVEEFWKKYESEGWLRALRASGLTVKSCKQQPDGSWELNLDRSAVSDLTVLRGAPISALSLHSTAVTDLSPLRNMPLKRLNLTNSAVTDLSPLSGMPLDSLILRGTRVTDLSPLRGMRLTGLYLSNCRELTDLSPLAACQTLKTITLPPQARDIGFLRDMSQIERISFQEDSKDYTQPAQRAVEFWEGYDEKSDSE